MMLPSPLGSPPLRELPGACAFATSADDTISAAVKIRWGNLFAFMNKLLSFLLFIGSDATAKVCNGCAHALSVGSVRRRSQVLLQLRERPIIVLLSPVETGEIIV